MKFEKRSSGAAEPTPPAEEATPGRRKPVVVYIMILFIVAFLLMAASFFMHQRSNSEAIGQLRDSVTALQEVQATQDKNVRLQEDLETAQNENTDLQKKAADAATARDQAEEKASALLALYTLQQQYATGNYAACRQTIQSMEDTGLAHSLPEDSGVSGVTSPVQRYQQLKEAVMSK